MIQLDEDLRRVAAGRPGWTEWHSLAVVGALCAAMRVSSVAWDFEAGERWAHLQSDGELSATVRMSAPLVFLAGRLSGLDLLLAEDRLVVVRVADRRVPELQASLAVVAAAFPERPLSSTLDLAGFSVLDLCFASD